MTAATVDHRAVLAELERRPAASAVVHDAANRVQLLDAHDRPVGPLLSPWDLHVMWDFAGDEACAAVVEGARMAEEQSR